MGCGREEMRIRTPDFDEGSREEAQAFMLFWWGGQDAVEEARLELKPGAKRKMH